MRAREFGRTRTRLLDVDEDNQDGYIAIVEDVGGHGRPPKGLYYR